MKKAKAQLRCFSTNSVVGKYLRRLARVEALRKAREGKAAKRASRLDTRLT